MIDLGLDDQAEVIIDVLLVHIEEDGFAEEMDIGLI